MHTKEYLWVASTSLDRFWLVIAIALPFIPLRDHYRSLENMGEYSRNLQHTVFPSQ